EFNRVVKRLGAIDGVLAGHRVRDEEDLIGLANLVNLPQLVHRHLVDVQTAGGVEDDRVEEVFFRVLDGVAADYDRVAGDFAVDGDVKLFAEHLELIDRGGALQIGGDEGGLAAT